MLSTLGVSATPVTEEEYQIISKIFELQGYELSEYGTKRVIINEVDGEQIFSIGWLSPYSSESTITEYLNTLEKGIGNVIISMSARSLASKCFDNFANSTPNINCTAVIKERFEISVYLPTGHESEFIEMMIHIYKSMELRETKRN
jgi:hypothetical protein